MLTRINEIKCIGSVGTLHPGKGNEFSFSKQTVLLADNAVGKTTLAAILKSYGRKDPSLLAARAKLGAPSKPSAILEFDGDIVRFQDNSWHGSPAKEPTLAIFDQAFINENVFSTEVTSDHLKNMHLIVLGAKGASLNMDLEKAKEAERVARRKFKTLEDELGKRKKNTGRADYLDLPKNVTERTVSEELSKREGSLKALQQKPTIDALEPPKPLNFALGNFTALREALSKGADTAHEEARARVKNRLDEALCGHEKAEAFLQTGMELRPADATCPFCGQPLEPVNDLLADYKQYFDEAFEKQKKDVVERLTRFRDWSPETQLNKLQAAQSTAEAVREKWKAYVPEIPEIPSLTPMIEGALPTARSLHEQCTTAFEKKIASLDHKPDLALLDELERGVRDVKVKADECDSVIADITGKTIAFKQSLGKADSVSLQAEVKTLRAVGEALHKEADGWRVAYNTAKDVEQKAKQERVRLDKGLEDYCLSKYKNFRQGINDVLRDFGLKFRVDDLDHKSSLQSSQISATLSFSVDGVSVSAVNRQETTPCFRNTLSESEKNALAFAFFVTNLLQSEHLDRTIVVLDDPLSSFDDNRREQTAAWVSAISQNCEQVLVFTHRKDLLGLLHGQPSFDGRFFKLEIDASGSADLAQYEVKEAQRHEHEKRVAQLGSLVAGESTETETVPLRIRRMLEFVLRLKYCRHLHGERDLTALINRLREVNAITNDVAEKLRYLNKRTQTGCHAEAEQDPVHDLGLQDWKSIARKALEALDEV